MAEPVVLTAVVRHPEEPVALHVDGRLPRAEAEAPLWAGRTEAVQAAFAPLLGPTPWFLRWLEFVPDDEQLCVSGTVELVAPRGWEPPPGAAWVEHDAPPAREPWERFGWRDDAVAWIEQACAGLGHVVEAIEQVKSWSLSSVLRVRTDGPVLYFKESARLPAFAHEAVATRRLAELFPGRIVGPVAADEERNWMLLPSFDEVYDFGTDVSLRAEALGRHARLQRESAEHVDELLAAGCLDRRLPALAERLEGLDLGRLRPVCLDALRRLDALGLPPTLVHGDLHMVNVARFAGEIVVFDWTDASVAHPFADLLSLQWAKDEVRAVVLPAYLEAWEGVVSPAALEEAAGLARILVPLHHAVAVQEIVESLDPVARPQVDAVHVFLREAIARAEE